ncbi:hypothetical protein KKC83_01565 [Patescibacteria group bacterium]|nr:hypothetical protein [Candidatus Falkowbacteria bacterium]MBU4014747.1 hypothetical protein [Patescibacteria group bacterium]MBU4026213.1 hypothetical protein [Patescibacteria group bacterium]MBU4072714.1 hypothetical protein [Patescibacteria group bacterium]MBU4124865.1 hypothetical protein [Patescibacteria group bacterium]
MENKNEMNYKKIALMHALIGGLTIPYILNLMIGLILLRILPFIGAFAYIMFPLTYILPIVYIGIGVKYSSMYLSKKSSINNPDVLAKSSTIYYTVILISISIIFYLIRSVEIIGIEIILVPSFYLFTKKYFTKK